MPAPVWNAAATPVEVLADQSFDKPVIVLVDPNGGNVQIQFKNQAGNWVTPADSSYTISVFGPVELPRASMPDTRILATGGARFQVYNGNPY